MLNLISTLCKCIFRNKPPIAKSIEDIKAIVDKAIKNEDHLLIDTIEEQCHLRIAQKYIEQIISNNGLDVSFESKIIGIRSLLFALFGIGIAYFLVGAAPEASTNQVSAWLFQIIGLAAFIVIIILWYIAENKANKKFEKIKTEIKFMEDLVLRIEERLEK